MTTTTIVSGHWANAEHTCAIVETEERGSIAISPDRPELWDAMQAAITAGTLTIGPAPTPPVTPQQYADAIQKHIDATARAREYLDAVTCASYHASTNSAWQADALAFAAWRDAVWASAYQTLAAVQAGQVAPPTVAGLIASLPAIAWPAT